MNINKPLALLFSASLLLGSGTLRAQLADTIWTGNATVTIPQLTPYSDGQPLPYPKTVSNLSVILPVEVWFWDASTFLVVFRQRDVGADPGRAPLQPAFGEWTIPLAARIGKLRGISRIPYGSDLYEVQTGRISRKTGISPVYNFTAETKDTADRSGYDRDWIYPNARTLVTGTARLINSSTLSASLTSVTTPNPDGPNSLKISNGNPSATIILTKTNRRPSTVGVGVFDDARY